MAARQVSASSMIDVLCFCRWLREARQLEQLGYRGRTDISETVRPGKTDYGFDYTKNYKERTDRPEP